MLRRAGIIRSAITASDGTVNFGYLAGTCVLFLVLGVIPCMSIAAGFAIYIEPKQAADVIKSWGYGTGAVCAGLGTALAAVGVFSWGDSRSPPGGIKPDDMVTHTDDAVVHAKPSGSL